MGAVARSDEPAFQRVAIVGLGLIGGSIALGVRTRWPGVRLLAVDRPEVLDVALARGAIDDGQASIAELGRIDLLVLAAPVGQNAAILAGLGDMVRGSAVVTDVGGTKRGTLEAAAGLPERLTFVGGHPIGGAAKSGFAHARGTLFFERPWILTPGPSTPEDAIARIESLARGLGARPRRMDAAEHDRVMAFVSHLPQLAASALMDVSGRHAQTAGLGLAGGGLADTTRLASSSAAIWRDVCASNADAIGAALDALTEELAEIRGRLARGEAVDTLFEDAARWRAVLLRQQNRSTED